MRGVALDRLHEVRDEIQAALQLHVDLRPGVVHHVAQLHQVVVQADNRNDQNNDYDEDDDQCDAHKPSFAIT